jgi:myosin heavy subunit
LTDYQATQRAWFELCRSHLAQANVLQRFENLSYHYAQLYKDHEGCGSQTDRVKELETRLQTQDQAVEDLTKSNRELQQENQGYVDRAAESSAKLSAVEKERDDLLEKNREQLARIKQLVAALSLKETALGESEKKGAELEKKVEQLTVETSQAEILRFNYVRQLVPTVVKRLRGSEEYQITWAEAFNASLDVGWLKGIRYGRNQDEVDAIIAADESFELEPALNFKEIYDGMFDRQFPYVEKVASSFRLPIANLMNILPAGEEITPGAGAF